MKRSHSTQNRINNLLPIYFACLDHESAATNSHQNVLLSLEVGLVGIQYLSRDHMSNFWILALVGISLCFLIGPVYEYRANNVDFWRDELLSLVKGTSLEKSFHNGGYGSIMFGKLGKNLQPFVGHWFTTVFIPLVILAWFVAFTFYPPDAPAFQHIGLYHWLTLILCESTWIGILVYLRSKQGRSTST
ncbi:hypothetical protein KBC79_02925 [Candidatus Woesebacteria bacterium]|nr:hypothetical protein [Candidatus Woesebacteria bacterium]